MRNWDSFVSACKGLLFFRLWKKKPNNQKPVFETAKERKSEREREREKERRSQTEKKVSRVSHNSLPSVLCLPSSLKATKRFESGRRRRRRRRRSSSSSSWRRKNEGTRSKTSDRGRLSRSSRRAGLCPKTRSRRSARCRPR